MVRAKSVLNMMMMSFGALAMISVLWVLYGYSMSFGNDIGAGLLGDPRPMRFGVGSVRDCRLQRTSHDGWSARSPLVQSKQGH